MQKTLTIDLEYPVEMNGKVYKSVTLESFKTKHFKHIPDEMFELFSEEETEEETDMSSKPVNKIDNLSEVEKTKIGFKMIPLICAMSDNPDVIEELELPDLFNVMDKFTPFFGQSFSAIGGKE